MARTRRPRRPPGGRSGDPAQSPRRASTRTGFLGFLKVSAGLILGAAGGLGGSDPGEEHLMLVRHHRLAIAGVIIAAAIAVPGAALASGSGSPSGKPAPPRASGASAKRPEAQSP